jgi:hypothetical protein
MKMAHSKNLYRLIPLLLGAPLSIYANEITAARKAQV